jgi:predicted NBD/HSP70 family sugar kinase
MKKEPAKERLKMVSARDDLAHLPAVPADMRISNSLRLLDALRHADTLSRSDLARMVNLGMPTVHRLVSDLLALGLVDEFPARQDGVQKGRPAVMYRLRDRGVLVAGVDIGNKTSRFAIASSAGKILTSSAHRTETIRRDLASGIANEVRSLVGRLKVDLDLLAGVGIGVAAAVDPVTGTLQNPPRHHNWQGLELRKLLEQKLRCGTLVRQDDHLAALAEASSTGTFPGAQSVVVLEIGTGIGAAMVVDGVTMGGAHGRFGRIAGWPVSTPRRGVSSSTLGASLTADGLVEDYRRRDGRGRVTDGQSLFKASDAGDEVADSVLAWAGQEIAELIIRLHRFCDPAGIVLGGGLARGFATLEPHLRPHLPTGVAVAPSIIGENAVVVGAILSSIHYADAWIRQRLHQLESGIRWPRPPDAILEHRP